MSVILRTIGRDDDGWICEAEVVVNYQFLAVIADEDQVVAGTDNLSFTNGKAFGQRNRRTGYGIDFDLDIVSIIALGHGILDSD